MGSVAVIGGAGTLEGFVLAGAAVVVADDDRSVIEAWSDLDDETALVVLSADAHRALADRTAGRPDVLTVVAP